MAQIKLGYNYISGPNAILIVIYHNYYVCIKQEPDFPGFPAPVPRPAPRYGKK